MNIICKGLSFVPTPKFQMTWKKYFCLKERKEAAELGIALDMLQDVHLLYGIADSCIDTGKGPMTDLRCKSTKMPPQGDISAIYRFVEVVLRDLKRLKVNSKRNYTPAELDAIKSLENYPDIFIKPSEKVATLLYLIVPSIWTYAISPPRYELL